MRQFIKVALVIATGFPGAAFALPEKPAAELTQVQGNVLVDTGKGFAPAAEKAGLKLGDRVMVTKGGAAVLSYGDACSFPLQSPSMTTIEPTACSTTTQGNQGGGAAAVMALGGAVGPAAAGAAGHQDDTPVSP